MFTRESNDIGQEAYIETTYPNCTVIVYKNIVTGQEQVCWFNNEEQQIDYEVVDSDE